MKKFYLKNILALLILVVLFNIALTNLVFANEGQQEETISVEFDGATINAQDNTIITYDDGDLKLKVQFLHNTTALAFSNHEGRGEIINVLKNNLNDYTIKIINNSTAKQSIEIIAGDSPIVKEIDYNSSILLNMSEIGLKSNGFIQIVPHTENLSNILWDYDKQDAINKGFVDPNNNVDCLVENGKVEIISVQLPGETETILAKDLTTYKNVWYGKKYTYDAYIKKEGKSTHAFIPIGSTVTIELIPDYGYQVTSAELNGTPLIANDDIQSRFSFIMPENPLHLQAIFNDVNNISNTEKSIVIDDASVEVGNKVVDSGSVLLTIQDTEVSNKEQEKFEEISSDYEISNYLEIGLDQIIYKGTEKDYWSNSLTKLNENVEITMKLNEELNSNDVVILHEHNGNYEVLNAEYEDGTITFETNSFSTYAVAYRNVETKKYIINNSNYSIEFDYNEGKQIELSTIDYLSLTNKEIEEMGMTKEIYAEILNQIKESLNNEGNLLNIFEINVTCEERNLEKGPFVFKTKLTDDMKKYNSFKFIFLDEQTDGSFKKCESVEGKIEGDYLVVTLPHLSVYAIVGNNAVENEIEDGETEEVTINNPQTGDTILFAIAGLIISVAGAYITKKKIIK